MTIVFISVLSNRSVANATGLLAFFVHRMLYHAVTHNAPERLDDRYASPRASEMKVSVAS